MGGKKNNESEILEETNMECATILETDSITGLYTLHITANKRVTFQILHSYSKYKI